MLDLTADKIAQFAAKSASMLLQTDEGKKAGYWSKPFLGKPRLTGSMFVIGTYTYFIMGCTLAGLSPERFLDARYEPQAIPEAESLVTFYLEFPEVKAILDQHFKESDEYAARRLSPEVLSVLGSDSRALLLRSAPSGRKDVVLLSVLWALYEKRQFTILEGMQGLTVAFLYGASMDPAAVERLWGIQASTTIVPLMEQPFAAARDEILADIRELIG